MVFPLIHHVPLGFPWSNVRQGACALRAVGRVCRFGHREAVSALMRCIRAGGAQRGKAVGQPLEMGMELTETWGIP